MGSQFYSTRKEKERKKTSMKRIGRLEGKGSVNLEERECHSHVFITQGLGFSTWFAECLRKEGGLCVLVRGFEVGRFYGS